MKVKKYEGTSLQEALHKVKADLGDDGVILYTYQPPQSRFFRLFGGKKCLIFATREVQVLSQAAHGARAAHVPHAAVAAQVTAPAAADLPVAPVAAPPAIPAMPAHEMEEMRSLLSLLRSQLAMPGYREEVLLVYVQLLDSGLALPLARELADQLQERAAAGGFRGPQELRSAARELLAARVSVAGPIAFEEGRTRVVALVGPTGVGKTTTIAKLAGNFELKESRRVGLVTLDNFRIAATEQLRTMAELMQVPLTVVDPEKDSPTIFAALRSKEVVLIDTAGRSPNDHERLEELLPFLQGARPDEVHLVLSATTHPDTLLDMADKFAPCRFNRIILTKLDEAVRVGPVLTALARLKVPVSYLTHGQGIPQDIEIATAGKLAAFVLPERPREVVARTEGREALRGEARSDGRSHRRAAARRDTLAEK